MSLVVHVMASDLPRGGQAETRTVCDALNAGRGPLRHEALTLFAGPPGNLRAEHRLDLPSGRARRVGFDPRAALALRRWIGDRRPSMIVAHGGEALKYALVARDRAPLVYHKIGIVADKGRRGARRALQRLTHRLPTAIIAVSHAAAHDAHRFGRRTDVVVVPNCRNSERFEGGRSASETLRVGFVGQLVASKRPQRFVDAVAAARAGGAQIDAVVIGDGPLAEHLDRAVVEVLGRSDDIPALLSQIDVLVLSSRPESEGMPGVLIEAGMAGCAVIATDVPGARDVVEPSTGIVVPVEPIGPMVEALIALAKDPAAATSLGAAGRLRCRQLFDVGVVAAQWERALQHVASVS